MKPIRVFEIIAKRRMAIFGFFCLLVIMVFVGLSWDIYKNSQIASAAPVDKVMADGEIIKQTDTTDYSNYNIIIPSGVTATIDGEHQFNNLTIQNGGTLTSTDYNSYGIYNAGNPTDRTFENIMDSVDGTYTFIMRGVINVGANPATYYFSPCSGIPSNLYDYNKPSAMTVNDIASIEFYTPITTTAVYDDTLWTGVAVGNAFSSNAGGLASFTDNVTSTDNPILPFEMRFTNLSGDTNFGICRATADPTQSANNFYLTNVDIDSDFSDTATTPQIKSISAWQGASLSPYTGVVSDYSAFTTYIENFQVGSGYNTANFFQAKSYDFANDKKVTLSTEDSSQALKILTTRRVFVDRTDQNELDVFRESRGVTRNTYSTFYTNNPWYSPLASRYIERILNSPPYYVDGWYTIKNMQPLLSKSLVVSMPIKQPTKISVANTFSVEDGGVVNLNGRGFAYSGLANGSGPAGATPQGAGASHSGLGGTSLVSSDPTARPIYDKYDSTHHSPPKLPGSGSSGMVMENPFVPVAVDNYNAASFVQYDYGGGGGFIYINAGIVNLEFGSMIMANGVGGITPSGLAPAGASGGSIVIADNDSNSKYDGLITAQGASTLINGAPVSAKGGGGGGYIFITTSTDINNLQAKQDTSHISPLVAPAEVKYPTTGTWTAAGIGLDRVSVMQGGSELNTSDHDGHRGFYTVVGQITTYRQMKKTLIPIDRNGSSDFNPYELLLGDRIKVLIEVNNLAGSDKIRDEIPKVNLGTNIVECVPESGTITPAGVYDSTTNPLKPEVRWHSDGHKTFSYECIVTKK